MARIKLDGLSYFPLDTSFFDSRKIKVLRSKFGCEGICLYIYLLAEIYRDRGYYLSVDEDFYAIVADDNGLDEDRVREIVAYFCRNNFFNPTLFDKNILTSSEIQKQYQESVKRRGEYRAVPVRSDVWLLKDEESEDYICYENGDFCNENSTKKSKENKSKVNESKEKKNICIPVGDKKAFADNVLLTDKEYQSLIDRFGHSQTDEMLKKLSHYKSANGKEYKSDYDAIFSWVLGWYEKNRKHSYIKGKTGEKTFDAESFAKWEFENTYGAKEPMVL